jgi:hypothetical protein
MREAKTTLAHLSYDPPVSFVQKIKQHFLNVCNKIIDENDDEELLKYLNSYVINLCTIDCLYFLFLTLIFLFSPDKRKSSQH